MHLYKEFAYNFSLLLFSSKADNYQWLSMINIMIKNMIKWATIPRNLKLKIKFKKRNLKYNLK